MTAAGEGGVAGAQKPWRGRSTGTQQGPDRSGEGKLSRWSLSGRDAAQPGWGGRSKVAGWTLEGAGGDAFGVGAGRGARGHRRQRRLLQFCPRRTIEWLKRGEDGCGRGARASSKKHRGRHGGIHSERWLGCQKHRGYRQVLLGPTGGSARAGMWQAVAAEQQQQR